MCNLYLFLIAFIVTLNASESIKRNNYNNNNNGRRYRLLISKKATSGAKKQKVVLTEKQLWTCCTPGGERGYSGAQLTGMIEGFRFFFG